MDDDENGIPNDDTVGDGVAESEIGQENADVDGLGDGSGDPDSDADSGADGSNSADSSGGGIVDKAGGSTPDSMAKNALRKANKQENAGSVSLVGDPRVVSGITVKLANFGSFDSKYIASKTVHKVDSGYTVDVDVRKCLNGY